METLNNEGVDACLCSWKCAILTARPQMYTAPTMAEVSAFRLRLRATHTPHPGAKQRVAAQELTLALGRLAGYRRCITLVFNFSYLLLYHASRWSSRPISRASRGRNARTKVQAAFTGGLNDVEAC